MASRSTRSKTTKNETGKFVTTVNGESVSATRTSFGRYGIESKTLKGKERIGLTTWGDTFEQLTKGDVPYIHSSFETFNRFTKFLDTGLLEDGKQQVRQQFDKIIAYLQKRTELLADYERQNKISLYNQFVKGTEKSNLQEIKIFLKEFGKELSALDRLSKSVLEMKGTEKNLTFYFKYNSPSGTLTFQARSVSLLIFKMKQHFNSVSKMSFNFDILEKELLKLLGANEKLNANLTPSQRENISSGFADILDKTVTFVERNVGLSLEKNTNSAINKYDKERRDTIFNNLKNSMEALQKNSPSIKGDSTETVVKLIDNLKTTKDLGELLKKYGANTIHSALGFAFEAELVQFMRKYNLPVKNVGTTDSKTTSSDVQVAIGNVEQIENRIGATLKHFSVENFHKNYDLQEKTIKKFFSDEAIQQINYFIMNYQLIENSYKRTYKETNAKGEETSRQTQLNATGVKYMQEMKKSVGLIAACNSLLGAIFMEEGVSNKFEQGKHSTPIFLVMLDGVKYTVDILTKMRDALDAGDTNCYQMLENSGAYNVSLGTKLMTSLHKRKLDLIAKGAKTGQHVTSRSRFLYDDDTYNTMSAIQNSFLTSEGGLAYNINIRLNLAKLTAERA